MGKEMNKYYGYTKNEFIKHLLNEGADNSTTIGFVTEIFAERDKLKAEIERLKGIIKQCVYPCRVFSNTPDGDNVAHMLCKEVLKEIAE